jgi:hypothetical protein
MLDLSMNGGAPRDTVGLIEWNYILLLFFVFLGSSNTLPSSGAIGLVAHVSFFGL